MLGHRIGETLFFSPVITFRAEDGSPESDEEARIQALNRLSFFIAHSLHHVSTSSSASGQASAESNPSVLAQSTSHTEGPSRRRDRSDSAQTIQPSKQSSWGGSRSTQMNLAKQVGILHLYSNLLFNIMTADWGPVCKEPESQTELWTKHCSSHSQVTLHRSLHHIWLAIP
jgi:hypothetical protein